MLNRTVGLFLFLPFLLSAAEFWESKAFPDWTDKDLQKMISGSPWARRVDAIVSGGAQRQGRNAGEGGVSGMGRGMGGGMGDSGDESRSAPSANAPAMESGRSPD